MIVTLTANPSMDRTIELESTLTRGAVHRGGSTTTEAGGKGVNVARVLTAARVPCTAVLPATKSDPILAALSGIGVMHHSVSAAGPARTNLTLSEPDGTTTKINEPGTLTSPETATALMDAIVTLGANARWVVLSGSLPPGVPAGWYGEIVRALRSLPCRVAVDTSDRPLTELAVGFPDTAPDLMKPNAEELAWLTGQDGDVLERSAAAGDPGPTAIAASLLVGRGAGAVLATLGAAGAVLVTASGAWAATPPRITPRSTVGAGDSSLAGYLLGDLAGENEHTRLARAVAYGTAAAALPGTALPTPSDVTVESVTVRALDSPRPVATG